MTRKYCITLQVTAVWSAGWLSALLYVKCDITFAVRSLWQIPTDQTSRLGGDRHYMQKFLSIIDSKINCRVIDTTLKFTLSALWNLSGNVVNILHIQPRVGPGHPSFPPCPFTSSSFPLLTFLFRSLALLIFFFCPSLPFLPE